MINLTVELEEHAMFAKAIGGSEGYDMLAMESAVILPQCRVLIGTGVKVKFPPGYYGLLSQRSSFGNKEGGLVFYGVIDNDYRGEIKMVVYNTTSFALRIRQGDVIGQLVIQESIQSSVTLGTVTSDTERGEGGFGSTNKFQHLYDPLPKVEGYEWAYCPTCGIAIDSVDGKEFYCKPCDVRWEKADETTRDK